MTSRRTVLAAGLAGSAGLLAGCRTSNNVTDTSPGGTVAASPAYVPYDGTPPDLPGDGATGVPDGFLKYPDPIRSTGRVPVGLSAPVTMLLQGIASDIPPDQSQWWRQTETDLGNKVSIGFTDSTQYVAKFQTAIAGNSLSDFTQIVPVPSLLKVLESTFTDLTPYLSGDNIKKYPNLANQPPASWQMCTFGGKIWGFTNPRIVAGTVMMTRADILSSKGISAVPALSDGEDFLAMCQEVTDKSKGVFAIGQIPQNWTIQMLLESMGAPNFWKIEGDKWISAYETDEYAAAMETLVKMWEAGVFHPNTYTDLSSTATWFDTGVTVLFAQGFSSWQARMSTAKFPVGAVEMPKWNGGGVALKHLGAPGYSAPVGIKKTTDEKRIDELLKVADYLSSPFGTEEYLKVTYGVRDRQYRIVDGDVALIPDPPAEALPGISYIGVNNARNIYLPGKPDATRVLHDYCKRMIPTGVVNPQYGKFSDTEINKGANALRDLGDAQANIIQGRASMTEWPNAVAAWKSAAGDQIAQELAAS